MEAGKPSFFDSDNVATFKKIWEPFKGKVVNATKF